MMRCYHTYKQLFLSLYFNPSLQKPIKPGMLTAKELTGAPLISYVPKSRKLRARASEPLGRERLLLR